MFLYTTMHGNGMGIRSCEWEEVGSKKSFLHISTSYHERIISLYALTLEHERIVSDVSLLHRFMHGKMNYCSHDIGIKLVANNERSGKFRLIQHHHASRGSNALFHHSVVSEWNALPERISKSSSFDQFKKLPRADLQNLYSA